MPCEPCGSCYEAFSVENEAKWRWAALGDGDRVIGVLKAYYLSFWILPCLQLIISWVKNIFKSPCSLIFKLEFSHLQLKLSWPIYIHSLQNACILKMKKASYASTFVEGKIQLPSSEKYATRSHRHRHHHLNFCSYKMEDRTQDSKVSRWIDRTYRSSLWANICSTIPLS